MGSQEKKKTWGKGKGKRTWPSTLDGRQRKGEKKKGGKHYRGKGEKRAQNRPERAFSSGKGIRATETPKKRKKKKRYERVFYIQQA